MNLYLLRHGVAVERGTRGYENDDERPLTPKGRRKLRCAVKAMRAMDLSFDAILSSPLVRARQTADMVGKGLHKKVTLTEHLAPGAKFATLIRYLRGLKPTPENALLVGHEPDLSELASLLMAGSADALAITFKKGGLCKLSAEQLQAGKCASLEWLLAPSQMELMA